MNIDLELNPSSYFSILMDSDWIL